ncbi:MAG: glycosyltransferase family 2 protein [Candidatus Kapaibacterium sp.]
MICIVIPNYNGLNHLEVCFNSLRNQSYKNFNIILVDNGSIDDSVEYVNRNYPEVKVLKLEKNYGFAFATNAGIIHAINSNLYNYILFLNNDMECDEFFLENLVSGFTSDEIGSTTPKILNYYSRDLLDTTGDYYDFYSYPYKRGGDEKDIKQYQKRGFVFGGCGGSTIYRTELFRNIGLLDDSFFAYYEDIDFNYRMQLAGFKCVYIPEAVCYHKCGATIKNTLSKKFFLMERNLNYLQIKNHNSKLILKYSIISTFNRHWNYLRFIKRYQINFFTNSVAGFWVGLFLSYRYFNQRKQIKKFTVASSDYIEDISMDYKRGYKEFDKYNY